MDFYQFSITSLTLGVTNDKFPRCTQIGVIHNGAFKNHNIANNYHTNVIEVSFCSGIDLGSGLALTHHIFKCRIVFAECALVTHIYIRVIHNTNVFI